MFSSPAIAQTAGAAAPAGGFAAFTGFVPIILMIAIFYFLLIRPQQTRAKNHKRTIDALRKGDTVITAGGIVGRVNKVDEEEAEVEIAPNVRVRVVKSTLSEVRSAAKPAND